MSGKKHVFKIVPGKSLMISGEKKCYMSNSVCLGTSLYGRDNADVSTPYKIAKLAFIPLNDESEEMLTLNVNFCQFHNRMHICLNESGQSLNTSNKYNQDATNNSLIYLNDKLVNVVTSVVGNSGEFSSVGFFVQAVPYQYVTRDESGKYYFSDKKGNIIDSLYDTALRKNVAPCNAGEIKEIVNNMLLDIPIQLQKIIPELSSNQLQVLAENLTDEQLQTLVDHLTNHQLQTLAQELNPEKLQIIVPILNNAQLEALVEKLNPEQVKEILPHLKVDQFKALIKTLNDEQFTVLAKDLAEHHLTILSKELEGDQLKALVNSLQEEQLKDLVNKLDPEKLEAIAQDLTDSNRIQMIIKSLVDNPDKLQAFAHNMPDQQFAKLLNELNAESLKDIIHKLPYEKVTAVIGDLGNQDQSKAIIDALKGKLEKQNEKIGDLMEKIDQMLPEQSEANWDNAHLSPYVFQDTNTEFTVIDV